MMNAKQNIHGDTETVSIPRQSGQPSSTASISSESLFGQKQEVGILHHGELYRLRITRQNKLILTK